MVYAQKIEKQKLLIWDEQKYSWSYYPLSIIITLFIVLFFVIILGLIAMFYIGYGLYFWAIGFGILHIVYGLYIYYKYERG